MIIVQDYAEEWHRVDKMGIDYLVTLCGMYIKPNQWMVYPGWKSVAVLPDNFCGGCRT